MRFQIKKFLLCLLILFLMTGWSDFYIICNEYDDVAVQEKAGNVIFLNKSVKLTRPMCFVAGRLFLPLEELIGKIGGSVVLHDDGYTIRYENLEYELMRQQNEMLVHDLFFDEETPYISLYDFAQLFHLAVVFDNGKDTVRFYKRQMPVAADYNEVDDTKKAFLRLEDFTTQPTYDDESLEKFRVLMDYLYTRGQSYYIAWIPLYVNPPAHIRNDVTKDFNFYNADFIYTLDYAVNHYGHIVLHGYTHQENDTVSGIGMEFGKDSPFSRQEIDERMKQAKKMAKQLGYDDSIFEFPHTSSTPEQLKIAESNFDIIYQQSYYRRCIGKIDQVKHWKHTVLYVPTPVGYISNYNDLPDVLERIDNLPADQITSMFIHPYLDFKRVRCWTDTNAQRVYQYDEDGIIAQLVSKITEKNKVFSPIR